MVFTQRHKTAGAETSRQRTGRQLQTRKPLNAKQPIRSSTAKDPNSRRLPSKEPPNEYSDIKDGIRHLWANWTATTNTRELWRRKEQHGLADALKKLSQTRADLSITTTLSSEDATNLTAVMVEFAELLNCIRLAFVDNEKEIHEDEYETKYEGLRFLPHTRPQILELWNSFTNFGSQFAVNIAQRCWHNSSEERELMRMTVEVVAASVKLLVLSVHEECDVDKFYRDVEKEVIDACSDLQDTIKRVSDLGDVHSTLDFMTEIIGWQLFAVNHLCIRVMRPVIEARDEESSFDEFDDIINAVERALKTVKKFLGITDKEPEAIPAPESLPITNSGKKASKSKSGKTENKDSKGVKSEHQVTIDEKKSSKDRCVAVLQNLSETYDIYSDDAWEKKVLPVLQNTSRVKIKYRMECYSELGRTSVEPCPMIQRKTLLDKLSLTDNYSISSEIFVFDPVALACSKDVIVEMPVIGFSMPAPEQLIVKIQTDGSWSDLKVFEKITIDDEAGIRFNTQNCEAFVVVTCKAQTEFVVGPTGGNFISEDVGKVEIHVPPDCYDHETTLKIKTIPFNTSSYPDMFVGVIAASVAVDISPDDSYDDSYKDMKKYMTVQLPIKDDDDDKDSEVVVVRYNGDTTHVLDKKQVSLKTIETGLYTVDVKGYWCISVVRIRRIFLNMRDTIKKEFLAGYKKKVPCKLVTFIDDITRGNEKQTFVMEVVEKCNADIVPISRRKFGLVEIKKGRSKDILLKTGEVVRMLTDGQMRPTEPLSDNHYNLCYIPGLPNVIHVATEVKRDPEKLPDAMLVYQRLSNQSVVHSIALMTRDLSEMPTEDITARAGTNVHMLDGKHMQDDEKSLNILKMESLMSLARELTFSEGSQLGHQLGVKPEKILKIKEDSEKDPVGANFQILCQWRGRFVRATMADFLVSSLKAVGKPNYAAIITEVRRHNRVLEKKDFEKKKSKPVT